MNYLTQFLTRVDNLSIFDTIFQPKIRWRNIMIGHRLRTARAASGLALRGIEGKIDNLVTAQALSKYEQDEMMPGSQVLIAVAKALRVSEDYLLSEQEMSLDGVEFRKKAKMG